MSRIADFLCSTWTDPWFLGLPSSDHRILFIYLFTNEHASLCGVYSIALETIATETKLEISQIPTLMIALYPKVQYDEERSVVFVLNYVRLQFMRGEILSPSLRIGIRKAVIGGPRAHRYLKEFCEAYPNIMTYDEYPFGETTVLNNERTNGNQHKSDSGKPKNHADNARFMEFWSAYPRKDTGPTKPYKMWPDPMSDELFATIMQKLLEFKQSAQWQGDPDKVPMATTWLNQKRWEGVVNPKVVSRASNTLPAAPGKYANVGTRVTTNE